MSLTAEEIKEVKRLANNVSFPGPVPGEWMLQVGIVGKGY